MTQNDLELLQRQDHDTLADWWQTLNCWEWPKVLPHPEERKPPGHNVRRTEIMNWIFQHIGKNRCLSGVKESLHKQAAK